uniref:mediator of RNA polymerase II transcription subunit 20 n=1 Tax=Myxine glutinosa TaxID=7769 RepID=UPI00358E32C3
MGVTCVCQWPPVEGKSVQQSIEQLHKRLEGLGATKQGTFVVDCESFHHCAPSSGQQQKTLYVMHSTEFPLSCFALYEGGPCMTADASFTALMLRLKGAFQNAKGSKVEARGQRYRYADFYVRLGAVTIGPNTKGVSVEVEYCPSMVPADCWGLLQEFTQSFMGSNGPLVPPTCASRHDGAPPYNPSDTMIQYMELFNRMRKHHAQSSNISIR